LAAPRLATLRHPAKPQRTIQRHSVPFLDAPQGREPDWRVEKPHFSGYQEDGSPFAFQAGSEGNGMIIKSNRHCRNAAFSLAEALTAMALALISIGGLVSGFMQSSHEAEFSSYSLAAQSQALRGLEQVRAAKWDPLGFPQVDQVMGSNFPPRVEILDVPMRGDNITYVTNFTAISVVSADPPLKLIRVDSVWRFMERGMFTNTAATYRAPDQ
jgi:hypothetical protein